MTPATSPARRRLTGLIATILAVAIAPLFAHAQDAAPAGNDRLTDCNNPAHEDKETCIIRNLFQIQHAQIQQLRERITSLETPPDDTGSTSPTAADAIRMPVVAAASQANTTASAQIAADVHIIEENNRFWLAIAVALVGVLFLFLSLHNVNRALPEASTDEARQHKASNITNIVALHLIVFGTLIVVLTADVSDQLTAAAGILGALAGYIFRGINDRNA